MEYLCLLNLCILCSPEHAVPFDTYLLFVESCLHFLLDNGFFGDREKTS